MCGLGAVGVGIGFGTKWCVKGDGGDAFCGAGKGDDDLVGRDGGYKRTADEIVGLGPIFLVLFRLI